MQLSYRDLRFVWIFFVATTLQFASPSWLLGIWKIPCWRWEIQHGNVALVPLLLYHLCSICLRAVCCLQLVAAWWPCSFGHAACWRMCRSTLCPAEPGTVRQKRMEDKNDPKTLCEALWVAQEEGSYRWIVTWKEASSSACSNPWEKWICSLLWRLYLILYFHSFMVV